MATDGSARPDPAALLRLATWFSPSFPTGSFAFSHGLESALADGFLPDGAAVEAWIALLLSNGSGWNDLVLFAQSHLAEGDPERRLEIAELAGALAGSTERRDETRALGAAFAQAVAPWGAVPALPYPVAAGAIAAGAGIPLPAALAAFANGFAANLVAIATRIVPLGQSEAMRILKSLEPALLGAAERAASSTPDDLGSAAIASEIAAMRHEALPTRLFRS